MKIALVIERMDTERGGREVSTAQVASELARRGQDVTILCQQGSWTNPSVRIISLGSRGVLRSTRLKNFVSAVQQHISANRYDIVHTTLPIPSANVYQPRGGSVPAQNLASLRRRSIVERPFVHMFGPLNRTRRLMHRLEAQVSADVETAILPVSRMVADEFVEHYNRRSNVRVVYNAVAGPACNGDQRADWRQQNRFQLGLGQKDIMFLTVATNFALKGVSESIKAFARWYHSPLRKCKACLVIVGRELAEGHQRQASLRDVAPVVHFVPRTPQVEQWYSAADACVLLSWYDPCSRTVLEAARRGVPSITTRFNGAAELLDRACIVVPSPNDTKAVTAALAEIADPQTRACLARECLAASARISIDRHVSELLEVYKTLAGRPVNA